MNGPILEARSKEATLLNDFTVTFDVYLGQFCVTMFYLRFLQSDFHTRSLKLVCFPP